LGKNVPECGQKLPWPATFGRYAHMAVDPRRAAANRADSGTDAASVGYLRPR